MNLENRKQKTENRIWKMILFVFIASTFYFLFSIFSLAPSAQAIAPTEQAAAGEGLKGAGGILDILGKGAGFPTRPQEPEVVIGKIIQGVMLMIGVIFGILVIYGGYLWLIARGNEEYIKKAKGILEAAIIGFILVVGAYAITDYVVENVITAAFKP